MQKIFTFSLQTIISRWEHSAIINCENDDELIRLVKNQRVLMNLMLPAKIIKLISRAGEDGDDPKRTTLYQPGYYKKKDFDN
jgi:hypothetical protein